MSNVKLKNYVIDLKALNAIISDSQREILEEMVRKESYLDNKVSLNTLLEYGILKEKTSENDESKNNDENQLLHS